MRSGGRWLHPVPGPRRVAALIGLSRRRYLILIRSLCCAPHDATLPVEFLASSVCAGAIVHNLPLVPSGFAHPRQKDLAAVGENLVRTGHRATIDHRTGPKCDASTTRPIYAKLRFYRFFESDSGEEISGNSVFLYSVLRVTRARGSCQFRLARRQRRGTQAV